MLQILYLDADSLPLSSPDDFFLSPTYLERGNMFFPEVWKEGVPEASPLPMPASQGIVRELPELERSFKAAVPSRGICTAFGSHHGNAVSSQMPREGRCWKGGARLCLQATAHTVMFGNTSRAF